MSTRTDALPGRGEVVYDIIYVRDWMRDKLTSIAEGVVRYHLAELLKNEPDLCYPFLEKWTKHQHAFLESAAFYEGVPGCLRMAYGHWVDYELRLAITNRISAVRAHSAWQEMSPRDQLRLTLMVVHRAVFRAAFMRGYAWDREEVLRRGLDRVGREVALIFHDSKRVRHEFNLTECSPVLSYGPKTICD